MQRPLNFITFTVMQFDALKIHKIFDKVFLIASNKMEVKLDNQ